jgi:hypothetical protein
MAFTVEDIDRYNRRISETTNRINTLAGSARRSSGVFSMLRSQIGMFAMGAFGIYQGINFARGSVQRYDQQLQAEAQVKQGLQSTGGVSGRSFEQIKAQASQLQGVTLFGDEEILKAQSVLLTFTNIRNEIFDKATPAIADMAQKLGMDLQSATMQVGKALNDPIQGVTMLGRAGVQFSDEQKAAMKQYVEAGQMAEAQMIILHELQTQFGGSAAAAAETGLGPWKQLGNVWGDARETLGGLMLGVVNRMLPAFRSIVTALQNSFNWIKRNSDSIAFVAKVVAIATGALLAYKLVVLGIAKAKVFLSAITGTYHAVVGIATGKVIGLTGAMKALALATRMNPLGFIITVVAAATAGIGLLINRTNRLSEGQKAFNAIQSKAQREYLEHRYKVEMLARTIQDANAPFEERQKNLEKLKELSAEHFGALKLEADGVRGLDDALKSYLVTQQKEIMQKATAEYREQSIKKLFDYQAGVLDDQFGAGFWQKTYSYGLEAMTGIAGVADVTMAEFFGKNKQRFFNLEQQKYSYVMSRMQELANAYGFDLFDLGDTGKPDIEPKFIENENLIKGGEGVKNITINIDRLNGAEILQMSGFGNNEADDFAEKLKLQLLTVLNDVNYAI